MTTKPILCPICKKPVDPTSDEVPFCSDRCRLIDLGKWASGDYKVSSPIFDPDLLEELEASQLKAERRASSGDEPSED
jgi:uncharacterized protein